jgi:hypothetical protein
MHAGPIFGALYFFDKERLLSDVTTLLEVYTQDIWTVMSPDPDCRTLRLNKPKLWRYCVSSMLVH